MQKEVFPERKQEKQGLLKRRDWFVSGALVLVIYVILLAAMSLYLAEESYIEDVIHALPAIAAVLFILGWYEKRTKELEEKERRKKRYQARMYLSRLKKDTRDRG